MDKPQIHYIESSILAILFFVVLGIFVWLFYITFNVSLFLSTLIILSIFAVVFFLIKFSLKLKDTILFNEVFNAEYKEFKCVYFIYKRDVIKGGKSYIRFVNDYCNKIAIYPVKSKKRQAAKLLIKELLNTNKDLVEKYFCMDSFHYPNCQKLLEEFDTAKEEIKPQEKPPLNPPDYQELLKELNTVKEEIKPQENPPLKNIVGNDNPFKCKLNNAQIKLLTECINEINIFSTEVNPQILEDFFNCRLSGVLKSKNNILLAYLMTGLSTREYITSVWQSVIYNNKLILAPQKDDYLNEYDLSSANNGANGLLNKKTEIINKYIKQLKNH